MRWLNLFLVCILFLGGQTAVASAQQNPITPAPPAPDKRFGIVEGFWVPEETAELNVGWERIIFYWREIQPTGPEDWNTLHVLEEWLTEADANGRSVMGLLKNSPPWATDGAGEAGLPRGLYLPVDDPDNLWANYVRRVAAYYGPLGVHDWIVWNEPEIKPGVFGFEFDGTMADYVQLLKVTALAMREVDPEARIHLAGMTWWHDPTYLDKLLAAIAAEPDAPQHDYYFDAVTLHIYFRSETVRGITEEVGQILAKHNFEDKEIWINETNASPTTDSLWPVSRPQFPINLDQQAWFIVQAYALGFAAGADSIGVYKMLDILLPEGGEAFGILRPDKSKRPAFEAYKTTIANLSYFSEVAIEQESRQAYAIRFDMPRGTTHVLWARTAATATLTIPASQPTALLINATGERVTELTAVDGAYTIPLTGAICLPTECLVGGEPLFLVQQAPEPTPTPVPPTETPSPTPTATATLTPLPPTPTPQPTATATLVPSATPTALPAVAQEATPAGAMGVGVNTAVLGLGLLALGVVLLGALWVLARRRA
jgi:hypothetical protein